MTDVSGDLKRVLVEMGNSRKPVCFVSKPEETDLSLVKKAIVSVFNLQCEWEGVLVQVKSETWNGLYVDVEDRQEIPDKSVLKAIIEVCTL